MHAGPEERDTLAGRLLVASPQLVDPNFSRTVVLVLEHGGPGAVGVVLNRPMQVGVGEILAPWEDLSAAAPPGVIFSGGPVSPDAVIGLAGPVAPDTAPAGSAPEAGGGSADERVHLDAPEATGSPEPGDETPDPALGPRAHWHVVVAGVAVVDLSVPPEEQPVALSGARLFSGYAGWDAEQLEGEIDEGAWFILDARRTDVLGDAPGQLWHDVLQRQGGQLAMLASYPPTPTVN